MKHLLLALMCIAAKTAYAAHEFDGRNLENGEALYAMQCAACHGANLEGQPNWRKPDEHGVLPAPPHDETGHTWHHDNQLLFEYIKHGGAEALANRGVTSFNSGMPGFKDVINDDEIWNIMAFIKSTWSDRIQDIQRGRNPPH